jgi:hypothetical protein
MGSLGTGLVEQVTGWDGGLLAVTSPEFGEIGIFVSKDGGHWRATRPKGQLSPLSTIDRMVAGFGAAAYLLAWGEAGPVVWRTTDGDRWEAIPLNLSDLTVRSKLDLRLQLVAGPHGVLVVGTDAFHPVRYRGVYVWHSSDGRAFSALTKVPGPAETRPPSVASAATPEGFLLAMSGSGTKALLTSRDGTAWENISTAGLPIGDIDHLVANDDTVVAFGGKGSPAWYLRAGKWRQARIDPGRLPDRGVVPPEERRVNVVRNWGSGFIAVGNALGGDGHENSGLVWHSRDGSDWKRIPVRANGFESAIELVGLAVTRVHAVIIGNPVDDSGSLLLWRTRAPGSG